MSKPALIPKLTLFIAVLILWGTMSANGISLTYYRAPAAHTVTQKSLELACRFYGVNLTIVTDPNHHPAPNSLATIIDASMLNDVERESIPGNTPVMISGIDSNTHTQALRTWSEDKIHGAYITYSHAPASSIDVTSSRPDLTRELSGQSLPIDLAFGYCLRTTEAHTALLTYANQAPLLSLLGSTNNPTWFLASCIPSIPPDADIWFFDHGSFAEIAPYMLFIKNAFSDYIWHSDGHYANLTIDDPWLRQPYGDLNYTRLLAEMDEANFHTTIAYIPWNYDKPSSPEVINVFSNSPDRLSLCIHGNNNDHREFYRYENHSDNRWPAKSFEVQEANIRQALARVQRFSESSGLSVDRIMVFPHLIGPAPTLGLLKKYNFLGTSNAGYVPLDEPLPRDPLFWLRRTTDIYYGLASLDRTEPRNRTTADIATDLFLDNPILFVEHIPYFRHGIDAFNRVAAQVNAIDPNIIWCSLGDVLQHLYLMRRIDAVTMEIRTYSPDIIISNSATRQTIYHITKFDEGSIPVKRVSCDEKPLEYHYTNGMLRTSIELLPSDEAHVLIQYANDFNPTDISLEKNNLRFNTLRNLAEFRDLFLFSGWIGILIEKLYYQTGLYTHGIKGLIVGGSTLLLILVGCLYGWKRRKSRP